ncbi:MAG: hypothetical protein ACK5MK_06040, partial [Dysgonomonas sp.]
DNSYYFESYIAQAYQILKSKGSFDHFIFVADDLILNPAIDENNYKQQYGIGIHETFYPKFLSLEQRGREKWLNLMHILYFKIATPGLEIKGEFPSYDEALMLFKKNGIEPSPLNLRDIYSLPGLKKYPRTFKGFYSYLKRKREINRLPKLKSLNLDIPLVSGFSDHFVIANSDFKKFSHYCGLFAACRLFVEFAIPSALILSCKEKIKTEDSIDLKSVTYWLKDRECFEDAYGLSLKKLLSSFPEETLFIHPIKMSKWEIDI